MVATFIKRPIPSSLSFSLNVSEYIKINKISDPKKQPDRLAFFNDILNIIFLSYLFWLSG